MVTNDNSTFAGNENMATKFSKKFFKYIKASAFLPEYAGIPYSVTTKHKMRGTDGNGKPTDFNDAEKAAIKKGIGIMARDLKMKQK